MVFKREKCLLKGMQSSVFNWIENYLKRADNFKRNQKILTVQMGINKASHAGNNNCIIKTECEFVEKS